MRMAEIHRRVLECGGGARTNMALEAEIGHGYW
jgi:hypothetical protein